ncbi:MAG TPA: 2-phosphosulfolactate phosphatase [Tepidisphaeraceae bacterium]|nr:2-phosphosulfolactate phosphatase [Tepidisphaeraceae bacterium]
MTVDVVLLPRYLTPEDLSGRAVAVFDVLRATTTMTSALAAGVKEIRAFGEIDAAMAAAKQSKDPHVLAGERNAIKPPGFDLGNSPGAFTPAQHRGQTVFMATTNGTRALVAAAEAQTIFAAALVNASAVAEALLSTGLDITLLCSGTEGFVSTEDVLGAGAVIDTILSLSQVQLTSDILWMAHELFVAHRNNLLAALSNSRGGRNVQRAGLTPDLAFCAKLNSIPCVGVASGSPPVVRRFERIA